MQKIAQTENHTRIKSEAALLETTRDHELAHSNQISPLYRQNYT